MSVIGGVLISVASKVGATLVKTVLEDKLGVPAGGNGGDLVGTVIDAIAGKAGVAPTELPQLPQPQLEAAVTAAEADMPGLIDLHRIGLQGQFALLMAEQGEPWYQGAWRWGWMYLLAFFWLWRIVVLPIVNSRAANSIEAIDLAVLLTLTTWFISLYMGGHTVKALGESAINAVKSWKDRTA